MKDDISIEKFVCENFMEAIKDEKKRMILEVILDKKVDIKWLSISGKPRDIAKRKKPNIKLYSNFFLEIGENEFTITLKVNK